MVVRLQMLAADGARGLAPIYAGRVIAGFGIGSASNLTPLYISEIAPPAIRGQLVGMYEIGWQMGGLVGFFINYGVTEHIPASHKQWVSSFVVPIGLQARLTNPLAFLRSSPSVSSSFREACCECMLLRRCGR